MTHTLKVQEFTKDIDMSGSIKAVVYGPSYPSTSIVINQKDFIKLYKEVGESTVITLSGLKSDQDVLIHDVQKDVRNSDVLHVDFYAVQKGKKIRVNIPLVFTGVSEAVKNHGADLIKNIFEIEVEAEAKDLPHEIEVDLSVLKEVDDHITIADIKVSQGVKIIDNPEDVVVTATKHEEEKEESSTEIDMSSIGVSVEKGKKEETE